MIISAKSASRVRRQLSGWNQLRKRSEKIAKELTLDISDLLPLFDKRINILSQELNTLEAIWERNPNDCFEAIASYQKIPVNLITARRLLGWSETELGQRCGISIQSISRYERSNYKAITLAKAIAIAEVLSAGFRERGYQKDPDA